MNKNRLRGIEKDPMKYFIKRNRKRNVEERNRTKQR